MLHNTSMHFNETIKSIKHEVVQLLDSCAKRHHVMQGWGIQKMRENATCWGDIWFSWPSWLLLEGVAKKCSIVNANCSGKLNLIFYYCLLSLWCKIPNLCLRSCTAALSSKPNKHIWTLKYSKCKCPSCPKLYCTAWINKLIRCEQPWKPLL